MISELRTTLNQWYIAGCLMYTFLVKMVHMMQINYFDRLQHKLITTPKSQIDDSTLAHDCSVMSHECSELMSCMSIIPIFWFLQIFVESAATVMEFFDFKYLGPSIYLMLAYFFCQAGLLFYLIFVCDSVSTQLRSDIRQLISKLMIEKKSKDLPELVHQLEKMSEMEFTVCNMFNINRKLVISFTTSLITFTVLFIQIANGAIKSAD